MISGRCPEAPREYHNRETTMAGQVDQGSGAERRPGEPWRHRAGRPPVSRDMQTLTAALQAFPMQHRIDGVSFGHRRLFPPESASGLPPAEEARSMSGQARCLVKEEQFGPTVGPHDRAADITAPDYESKGIIDLYQCGLCTQKVVYPKH